MPFCKHFVLKDRNCTWCIDQEVRERKVLPMKNASVKNSRGEWVTPIEEPYYHLVSKECRCTRKFLTLEAYRAHYALVHILGL